MLFDSQSSEESGKDTEDVEDGALLDAETSEETDNAVSSPLAKSSLEVLNKSIARESAESKCRHQAKYGKQIQLNPAIAYFKGLVKIILYGKVLFIANI